MSVRNDSGNVLAELPFGSPERYGYPSVMVPRAVVYESLMLESNTRAHANASIHWNKRIERVWETEEAVHVEFEDGSVECCDLLIGADGTNSKVRNALFGEEYATQYEGMTGFCGMVPLEDLSLSAQDSLRRQTSASMTLGCDGHLGLSLSSPASSSNPSLSWFTSIELPAPPMADAEPHELKAVLLEQYKYWKSPVDSPESNLIAEVMSVSCSSTKKNSFLVLPRWYTPPLPHMTSLHGLTTSGCGDRDKTTGKGRIVLVGDAAHAMPPDAAQGVSLAVEDALTLALVLKHHISASKNETESISNAARSYEDIRLTRVNKIFAGAKARQNRKKRVTPIQQWIRAKMIWMAYWDRFHT